VCILAKVQHESDAQNALSIECQPWSRGGQFFDVDAQAAQFHGYDQQYQQLSKGSFRGQFQSFIFSPRLGIHVEQANRVLAQAAATPIGRFGVSFLRDNSSPCKLNAQEFTDEHVALYPQALCVEAKTGEGLNMCCMDIACELLPVDRLNLPTSTIFANARLTHLLRELVQSGINDASTLSQPEGHPAAAKAFESSLIDLLWHIANSSQEEHTSQSHFVGRLQAFRQARDYIHDGLQDGITIIELCRNLKVNRRALEKIFRTVVGMGPGNYIRALQLNQVRRDLSLPQNANLSIGDIAASRGMWHWSRFTRRYQLMFGELPSQTRLRNGIALPLTAVRPGISTTPQARVLNR
jgi:AraC family ethanolamine operon transcriptional activator